MAGNISEDEEEVAKVMEALLVAVVNGDATAALDRDLESNADPPKQARVEGAVSACDRQMIAEYKHTLGGSAPLDTYLGGRFGKQAQSRQGRDLPVVHEQFLTPGDGAAGLPHWTPTSSDCDCSSTTR